MSRRIHGISTGEARTITSASLDKAPTTTPLPPQAPHPVSSRPVVVVCSAPAVPSHRDPLPRAPGCDSG
jgi:hypothetical protein